jgi:2-hydroxychromene-2-carboxylate isomerase
MGHRRQMTTIDYYFSTISPFVYLARTRLEAIAARQGAKVVYKPLDVVALAPLTGGQRLAERHASRKAYRLQELRRHAAKQGMAINLQPAFFPTNAAPSSYAIIAAARAVEQGKASGDIGALVHGFCRAVWQEERNIAEDEVVRAVLSAHGFDPALADSGLLLGAETYAANLDEAVARGVFGTPFYIVTEERFWGQDRLEDLDLYLAGKL